MSDIAIKVEGLGKEYIIGHQKQGDLMNSFNNTIQKLFQKKEKESFWALKDVTFEIKKGEAVGIIGRNGAGKSTLLKILSRITEPTKGRFEINGRVSSLLEVGTGFHPELSGRENIYLNGTILGMKRREIKAKFDEIIDFSGVEKFLDTPVKHYSSGMKVRLAFSVAAHLEPEILIIDEVLAVGDAEFQKKCLGKMDEVSKGEGRTVVFVSHNVKAVTDLCSRGIMLLNGEMITNDLVENAIRKYQGVVKQDIRTLKNWESEQRPGNNYILVHSVSLIGSEGNEYLKNTEELIFNVELSLEKDQTQLDVTFHLEDEQGNLLFMASTGFHKNEIHEKGLISAGCTIPKGLLHAGVYTISRLLFVKDKATILYEMNNCLTFELEEPIEKGVGWKGRKEGIIKPDLTWELKAAK